MKSILLLSFSLLSSTCFASLTATEVNAQIKITSNNGNFNTGHNILIHEDFETGAHGSPILNATDASTGITRESGSNIPAQTPKFTNAERINGGFAGKASFDKTLGNYNSTLEYKNLGGLSTVYLSYYFKVTSLDPQGNAIDPDEYNKGRAVTDPSYFHKSRNIKLARLSGGYKNGYIQGIGVTLFHSYENGQFSTTSKDGQTSKVPAKWIEHYADGKWHRIEHYVVLSTPAGTANGVSSLRIDGVEIANYQNVVTEETGSSIQWLTMPYYVAHDAGDNYAIYYDNIVLSKDKARVELCDSNNYAMCKKSHIAKVISWGSAEITIDAKSACATAARNIYVFNADGSLKDQGVLICNKAPQQPGPG